METRQFSALVGAKSTRLVLCSTIAILAVYFPIACSLNASYEPADIMIELRRPHAKMETDSFAFRNPTYSYTYMADRPAAPQRSPMILYEDRKRLGPPHSTYADISKLGLGRFSHSHDSGYIFSSSDNSDPNSNGRKYWVVLPKEALRARADRRSNGDQFPNPGSQ